MSWGTITLIVLAASIAAWGLFMANVIIRRERQKRLATAPAGSDAGTQAMAAQAAAEAPAPNAPAKEDKKAAPRKPLSPGELAVSRRQFLNRSSGLAFGIFLGFFGMSSLSFLWPKLTGGFGTTINAGDYEEILAKIGPPGFQPLFVPEGRFFLTYYEGNGEAPVYAAIGAVDFKMQALYRKCVHLGCSVPHCGKSMLFECPCHGSKYRLHGEYFAGPAPRGLDRFPISVDGGKVMVDTGSVQTGPPRGTSTWESFAEPRGPFCVPT